MSSIFGKTLVLFMKIFPMCSNIWELFGSPTTWSRIIHLQILAYLVISLLPILVVLIADTQFEVSVPFTIFSFCCILSDKFLLTDFCEQEVVN